MVVLPFAIFACSESPNSWGGCISTLVIPCSTSSLRITGLATILTKRTFAACVIAALLTSSTPLIFSMEPIGTAVGRVVSFRLAIKSGLTDGGPGVVELIHTWFTLSSKAGFSICLRKSEAFIVARCPLISFTVTRKSPWSRTVWLISTSSVKYSSWVRTNSAGDFVALGILPTSNSSSPGSLYLPSRMASRSCWSL